MKNQKQILQVLLCLIMVVGVLIFGNEVVFATMDDSLVYVNDDWGKEEGNIIKSVTYEPNGDGTYKAHVSVDISCVDGQRLAYNYGGVGYCWYDHDNKIYYGSLGVDEELAEFSYTMNLKLEPGKTWKLKVYLAYDYYGDEEWTDVDFQMLELTIPEPDPLVYENSDWGKEEGNIIKSVTYEPNGDGTYKVHVSVDISCVDGQRLAYNYGGVGYCWYDHDNKIYYGSLGVDEELTEFSYTMNPKLEPGKTWKLKVYLAYDYYGDEEWTDVDFQMLELTIPEPEVYVGGVGMYSGYYLPVDSTVITNIKPTSGGYAYYKFGRLTLNNFSYTGDGSDWSLINSSDSISLVLVGDNYLSDNSDMEIYGLSIDGDLNISGTGTLNMDVNYDAIYSRGDVTIKDTTIIIDKCYDGISAEGSVTINNSAVTIVEAYDDGVITEYDVEIEDSTLDFTVNYGIYTYSSVNIVGSDITIDADCIGINGDNSVSISSSNVSVNSKDESSDDMYGAIVSGGNITIDSALNIQASTEANGTLGEYVPENHETYDWIKISYNDGWINTDGKWYYYQNGTMKTGWVSVGGKWYYMNSSGVMQTGWVKIGSRYYYMNSSGTMVTGWVKVGSRYYYMNSSGVMVTGWVKQGNKYYYMNSSGAMVTGWVYVGGKYYYMNSSGVMQTGWVYVGGKYYYMSSSGAMQTGWVKVGNNWYYMNSSGAMQTGWVKVGNNWYYMNSSGVMQTGTQVINGKTYNFNSSGVWIG